MIKIFKCHRCAQAKEDQKKLHTMLVLSTADTSDTLKSKINKNDPLAGTLMWDLFVNTFEPKMPQVIMELFCQLSLLTFRFSGKNGKDWDTFMKSL